MTSMTVTVLAHASSSLNPPKATPKPFNLKHTISSCSFNNVGNTNRLFPSENFTNVHASRFFKQPTFRIRSFNSEGAESYVPKDSPDEQDQLAEIFKSKKVEATGFGSSFLAKLAIAVGVAATITILSIGLKPPTLGSSFGIQRLAEGSSSLPMAAPAGFSFKVFGYKFILPEYAPGWIYFWLLMAAGCGLFISEEALNIWLGIGKEKALSITQAVQKYGNLIGFVERFSLGVRNPTAFLAGAMSIPPDCFFAGVCCGGMLTLPIQLVIGFLLRERPVFALATVATVVGIWTVFPYAVAASTAIFLYLRRSYST